jgi:tetratricopeptide (TPR) repeat protein
MTKRYLNTALIIGVFVFIVVAISLFLFPEWKNSLSGILVLFGLALVGVVTFVKGLIDIADIIYGDKKSKPVTHIDKVETLILSTNSTQGIETASTKLPSRGLMHNLPQPDYAQFIGREDKVNEILRILRPYPHSQHAIVTIDGVGGVGKSALALEVAYRYVYQSERFPAEERFEAIVWTSAKQSILTAEGIKTRPQAIRTLADIYAAIAVTLQREDITRALSDAEQATLIRNALNRQRTLLIVDNLETVDDEAVITFIQDIPAPTKVIITTRHRISVAYPIRLSGMPDEDAQQLIKHECTKKNVVLFEDDVRRLIEKTAGVPLAIVWSISLIHIGFKVDTVLKKLGDDEEDYARYCFAGMIESIREQPAYPILLALTLFSPDANREALGKIANLSIRERDNSLVHLEVLSLVDKQADRFKLPPLARSCALAELNKHSDLQDAISRRWIEYLKELCVGVDSEYYWRYRSFAFYKEGDTILVAIEWCREHGPVEDAIYLTYAAYDFLEVAGRWNELFVLVDDILSLAESIQDQTAIARLTNIKGWLLMQRGDLDKAEIYFRQSLEGYRQLGKQEGETILLQHFSALNRKRGLFDIAEKYCQQADDLAKQVGRGDLLALVNAEHGKLARDLQDWERAGWYFNEIADYFEKRVEQTPRDEALARSTWGHLAVVAYHRGNYQESKALCQKSLEFFETAGTKGYLATLKFRLALAEEALGEKENAKIHAQEAVDWFDRLGMKPDYVEAKKLFERL